jgi:hypothetical protein
MVVIAGHIDLVHYLTNILLPTNIRNDAEYGSSAHTSGDAVLVLAEDRWHWRATTRATATATTRKNEQQQR